MQDPFDALAVNRPAFPTRRTLFECAESVARDSGVEAGVKRQHFRR